MELENPPENPCFGCGPSHARGLHLRFERRKAAGGAEEVVTEYTPRADEIGWPGLMHTGLHFMVAFEASYWAALELGGHVAFAKGPATWDQKRLPPVGLPFRARARVTERVGEDGLRVLAVTESLDAKPFATLESGFRFSRRSLVEQSGLKLPQYLLDDMLP